MIKAIKLYLHKPLNCEWDELGKALHDLRYHFPKIMNHGINQYWFWQVEKERLKEKNGEYPTPEELPKPTKAIYDYIRENHPEFPTYSISAINQTLKQKWQADCKDVFYRKNKSLPTFKVGYPILATNQQYHIEDRENDGYLLVVTLFSRKHEGLQRFEIQLKTKKLNNSFKQILNRIISKEYRAGELKIIKDKRKNWFASIAYDFKPEEHKLNPDIVCGIDLGVTCPFYCAISNSHQRLYANDGMDIMRFRRQIRNRRKSYQGQSKFSTRRGKGRKHILKPIQKLSEKERNFRDTKYHQYTKAIIDFCIKNNAGTIRMEDLSSLVDTKQNDSFLKDWAVSAFHDKLKYKTEEAGIKIVFTDPKYTSQRCFKCGLISRENRPTQAEFKCVNCGHEVNADYNAAQNLTLIDIAEIVKNHA